MTHRCPAIGCSEQLEEDWKIICGSHWYLVPKELRARVNRRDNSSELRQQRIEEAVKAVERAESGGRLL